MAILLSYKIPPTPSTTRTSWRTAAWVAIPRSLALAAGSAPSGALTRHPQCAALMHVYHLSSCAEFGNTQLSSATHTHTHKPLLPDLGESILHNPSEQHGWHTTPLPQANAGGKGAVCNSRWEIGSRRDLLQQSAPEPVSHLSSSLSPRASPSGMLLTSPTEFHSVCFSTTFLKPKTTPAHRPRRLDPILAGPSAATLGHPEQDSRRDLQTGEIFKLAGTIIMGREALNMWTWEFWRRALLATRSGLLSLSWMGQAVQACVGSVAAFQERCGRSRGLPSTEPIALSVGWGVNHAPCCSCQDKFGGVEARSRCVMHLRSYVVSAPREPVVTVMPPLTESWTLCFEPAQTAQ